MAPKAAHPYARRPGPSSEPTGQRGVPATVRVRSTLVADLLDDIHAAGMEMQEAGHRLLLADRTGRRDLVLHTAGLLVSRGAGYRNR